MFCVTKEDVAKHYEIIKQRKISEYRKSFPYQAGKKAYEIYQKNVYGKCLIEFEYISQKEQSVWIEVANSVGKIYARACY